MTYESDLALLAAGSYWDIRQEDNPNTPRDESNRAPIPIGWELVPGYDTPFSGGRGNGFSARVYKNSSTGEVVISYAGTEFGNTTSGFIADFSNGNIPLSVGRYGSQAFEAAKLYQRVKADAALSDNITFTGHSLGGGLASLMAAWFNRPATVFAAAPFRRSADATQASEDLSKVLPLVKAQLLGNIGLITLNLAGELADGMKAILGDITVDANGAVITLAEGQAFVSFALVSDEDIDADQLGSISASYQTAPDEEGNSDLIRNGVGIDDIAFCIRPGAAPGADGSMSPGGVWQTLVFDAQNTPPPPLLTPSAPSTAPGLLAFNEQKSYYKNRSCQRSIYGPKHRKTPQKHRAQKYRSNRTLGQIQTAQSATEFVVRGGVA